MELMSSLLLCVLVALLPQTLGKSRMKTVPKLEIKFNNSLLIQQKSPLRKQVLLNINGPPLVNTISEMQYVFTDVMCRKCHNCMDRAIKAYMSYNRMFNYRPSAEELQEEMLSDDISYRTKRDVVPTAETSPEGNSPKKAKARKSKMNKSVTVTKYNMDGEVYALKVKETQVPTEVNDSRPIVTTCQVYNVKKSYHCDSPESSSLLASARKKANKKKAKKEENSRTSTSNTLTTQKTILQTIIFRKREVDNSQLPENVMPSVEELY